MHIPNGMVRLFYRYYEPMYYWHINTKSLELYRKAKQNSSNSVPSYSIVKRFQYIKNITLQFELVPNDGPNGSIKMSIIGCNNDVEEIIANMEILCVENGMRRKRVRSWKPRDPNDAALYYTAGNGDKGMFNVDNLTTLTFIIHFEILLIKYAEKTHSMVSFAGDVPKTETETPMMQNYNYIGDDIKIDRCVKCIYPLVYPLKMDEWISGVGEPFH